MRAIELAAKASSSEVFQAENSTTDGDVYVTEESLRVLFMLRTLIRVSRL